MKKLVIVPGGYHPWHAGHTALYQAAKSAFPSADVYVAATTDTSSRPFPFKIKKMLATAAGVPPNRFIQVKSPFRSDEITQHYDPENTQLIYVRSEKDRGTGPQPGTTKKDGEPGYLQPYNRRGLLPMTQHAYMTYLPVQQFGPGMTSATEIRSKWPEMSADQRQELVKSLYPMAAQRPQAVAKLVEILDNILSPAVSETVESVVADTADPAMINQVVGHLSSIASMLKQQDFAAVKAALADADFTAALDQLAGTATIDDIDVDDNNDANSSDYASEN